MNCQTSFGNGKWNNLATCIAYMRMSCRDQAASVLSFDVYILSVRCTAHTQALNNRNIRLSAT